MPDSDKAMRKYMRGKSSQELQATYCSLFFLSRIPVVFVMEGNCIFINADESMVGDGDFVGVTAQVLHNRFGRGERSLGIDHPLGLKGLFGNMLRHINFTPQFCHKLSPIYLAQGPLGKKILRPIPARFPFIARRNAPAWHNAMNMRMQPQLLPPGVQDGDHSTFGPQIFGVSSKSLDGLPTG